MPASGESDKDEGIAEALRRLSEAEADPSLCISLEEFEQEMTRLRGR
jgi:hypothetical protein